MACSAASARAVARPMPELAPVKTTTLPANLGIVILQRISFRDLAIVRTKIGEGQVNLSSRSLAVRMIMCSQLTTCLAAQFM